MKIISLLIIGILMLAIVPVSIAEQENDVTIEIKCPNYVEIGDLFDVEIWVHPNGNEVGWWFIQEFHWTNTRAKATGDPAKGGFRGNASIIGNDWKPPLLNGVPIWTNGTIDNANSTIYTTQSMCSNDTICPVTETSLLCTIPFRALSNGACFFYISQTVDMVGLLSGPGLDYIIETSQVSIGPSGGGGGGGSQPPDNPPDEPENEPPVANAGGPYSAYKHEVINFDATQSTDDGVINLCDWEFSDGVNEVGIVINRYFANPGEYTVTLTVYDDGGLYDSDTTNILIKEYDSDEPPDDPPDEPPEEPDNNDDTNKTKENKESNGQVPIEIVIVIVVIVLVLAIIVRIKYRKR